MLFAKLGTIKSATAFTLKPHLIWAKNPITPFIDFNDKWHVAPMRSTFPQKAAALFVTNYAHYLTLADARFVMYIDDV